MYEYINSVMATTIYTYLHNDDLNGSRIVSMDDCMCKLYDIRRDDSDFIECFKSDLQKPALYILLNKESRKAYVGETDDAMKRIGQHSAAKQFWTEAMVFLGTNEDTLSKTEVLYLEYLALEKASTVKTYDLTENSQSAHQPRMNVMQKSKTDKFFKYVQFLSKFVGCDIFEPRPSVILTTTLESSMPITEPVAFKYTSEDLKGRTYMSFNGEGRYCKKDIVYQIIKEFVKKYPNATFSELNSTFKRDFLGRWAQYHVLNPDIDTARKWKELGEDHAHYFVKPEEILTSSDGVQFCVCVEWDKNNIINILGIAAALGWDFAIVQ